jgi:hypothetical protein
MIFGRQKNIPFYMLVHYFDINKAGKYSKKIFTFNHNFLLLKNCHKINQTDQMLKKNKNKDTFVKTKNVLYFWYLVSLRVIEVGASPLKRL